MTQEIFLKLTKIDGESQDNKHRDEIDVTSWGWLNENSGTTHGGAGRGGGKVTVGDIAITKFVDKSSPRLQEHCFDGMPIAEGELTVRKPGASFEYLRISMKNILITSIEMISDAAADRVTERLDLNFSQISMEYTEQDQTGGEGTTADFGWDIASNTKAAAFTIS